MDDPCVRTPAEAITEMATPNRNTTAFILEDMRERVLSGRWRDGEMLPARAALAEEYGVALGTLERAVAVLISEGILCADSGRGTFVSAPPPEVRQVAGRTPSLALRGDTLNATVGIIANVIPWDKPETWSGQWSVQVLNACEQALSSERGVIQRFFNLVPALGQDVTPAHAVRELLAEGVDALLIIGTCDLGDAEALVEGTGIPLVCAEYVTSPAAMTQVCIDNTAGGVVAVRHLRTRGYRHLTYFRPFPSDWVEARLAGAQRAAGLDALRVFPLKPARFTPGIGALQMQQMAIEAGRALLRAGFEPGTGVVAPNDDIALGFMAAAQARGLEAGKDYGIIGFDDCHREAHLTSLRLPLEQLGKEAAGLVLRQLRGETVPLRIALQHQLIARSSTAPVRAEAQQV